MGTPTYLQPEMKFTKRELETAPGAPPAPCIDAAATISNASRGRSACVIDFFEARDRLEGEFEESSKEVEIKWKASKTVVRRLPSAHWADRLEELLYSLLSAATLIYLLLCIIGR